jgi:hypothetical protein
VATRRKVLLSPAALRALLARQALPAAALVALEAAGHAAGIANELLQPHRPATAEGAPPPLPSLAVSSSSSSSSSVFQAGGLLVGLLRGAPGCGGWPAGLEDGGAAWCWVACVASTAALHVYADANSLHPLRKLLGDGSGVDGGGGRDAVAAVLALHGGAGERAALEGE